MLNRKNLIIFLAMAVIGAAAILFLQKSKIQTADAQSFTINVSGRERNYLVYAPENFMQELPAEPIPAVIILHGGGGPMGSAQMMGDISGWPQKAEKENFLAVFPNGTPRDADKPVELKGNIQEWNDGSGRSYAEKTGVDDIAFINALIGDISERFPVDKERIFVTGFSNGASMAFRIGVELADRVAAIAPVAGVLAGTPSKNSSPVPLLYISGSDDKRPAASPQRQQASSTNPVVVWAQALKCPAPEVKTEANVKVLSYAPCRENSEVLALTIEGMGHVYPGAQTELWEQGADNPANDILNATDTVWEFFKRHKKSQ